MEAQEKFWDGLKAVVEEAVLDRTANLAAVANDVLSRTKSIESRIDEPRRTLDHGTIAVVPGEGLAGGGTIEKTVDIGLDFMQLQKLESARPTDIYVGVFSNEYKQHCVMPLMLLIDIVGRAMPYMSYIEDLQNKVRELEGKVRGLETYEAPKKEPGLRVAK